MAKIVRAALLGVAIQQGQKFAKSPRGQQLIAQAKQTAADPTKRAQLLETVKARLGQGTGGAAASRPGAVDPYPPATQPLATPATPATPVTTTRPEPLPPV